MRTGAISLALFAGGLVAPFLGWSMETQIEMSVGSTSNATHISDGTPGVFFKFSPTLSMSSESDSNGFYSLKINGLIRRYGNDNLRSSTYEDSFYSKASIGRYLSEDWEVGTELLFFYRNEKLSAGSIASADLLLHQNFVRPQLQVYLARTQSNWTLELEVGGYLQNDFAPTYDSRGNPYQYSHRQTGVHVLTEYYASDRLDVGMRTGLLRTNYTERVAEYSDGAPALPSIAHPTLSTTAWENEIFLSYREEGYSVRPLLGYRVERDLVFEARNATRLRFGFQSSIALPGQVTISPSISTYRRSFEHFRAEPLASSPDSDLRSDWYRTIALPATYSLSEEWKLLGQYFFTESDSNYPALGYSKHTVEFGFTVKL